MKKIVFLFAILLFFTGCRVHEYTLAERRAIKKMARLEEKHPNLFERETVTEFRTELIEVAVPGETVTRTINTRDTIKIQGDRVEVRYIPISPSEGRIEATVKPDTVRIVDVDTVRVEIIKPVTKIEVQKPKERWMNFIGFGGLFLLGVVIFLILQGIKKV